MASEDTDSPSGLHVHGSTRCPVCPYPFPKGAGDYEVMQHLVRHGADELAFAWLVADARLTMAQLAFDSVRGTANRYDEHMRHLATECRGELLR